MLIMSLAQTSRLYDFMSDLAAARKEREEQTFEDATEAAAKEVTFDDVLEELSELPAARKAYVMGHMGSDRRHFIYQLDNLFADAVEKIAKRRAWAEITKARSN
ncbi:hypothetical protein A9R05_06765 [Burkholderia sp. KK1]|nr:hypothetical protein A9R05_06765 [Burkholderia sp. KK1]